MLMSLNHIYDYMEVSGKAASYYHLIHFGKGQITLENSQNLVCRGYRGRGYSSKRCGTT